MHFVIVGNGVCGIEAALALRERDTKARITLVSDEHDHFFSRPALMYIFAGQTTLKDTEPYDCGLYERMGFERVSQRVAALFYEPGVLWAYAAGFFALMHVLVVSYEEPTLRRTFGEDYETYCRRVHRWWPTP